MSKDLATKSLVWQFRKFVCPPHFRKTGYGLLDEILPGGGWPLHGLTEILAERVGMGALRLVLPAIAKVTSMKKKVICVDPPYVPYPSSLLSEGLDLSNFIVIEPSSKFDSTDCETLKIYEDVLKFENCSIALIWLSKMSFKDSRRLQLAALSGKTWGIIFRPMDAAALSSSSPLKIGLEVLSLNSGIRNLKIRILKARGGFEGQGINLKL